MPIREEIAKISIFERFLADLEDWEDALDEIRKNINIGENTQDHDYFTDARRTIKSVLEQIQNTREFIQVKQEIGAELAAEIAAELITADLDAAFEAHQPDWLADAPPSHLYQLDEDSGQ